MQRRPAAPGLFSLVLLCSLATSCAPAPGELVPATADQDPRLPQLALSIAGHRRVLHLETFGDEDSPVLLVYHGGEGSDYRAMLPLAALADRYFVVMWDARGSGLSERIGSSEVTEQSYADEVHAVKQHFSPEAPVAFLGYSSGGFHGAIAVTHYPDDFAELALVEPDPFDAETRKSIELDVPVTSAWANQYLWQNQLLTPNDHALADYKLMSVTPAALEQLSCDPKHPSHYPMWRLGAKVRADAARTFDSADFRPGMAAQRSPVLIVASGCGPLSASFQRAHVAPVFRSARVAELGAGIDHLNIFDRGLTELLEQLRGFLRAYQEQP
jgi:proline iminopeptidase